MLVKSSEMKNVRHTGTGDVEDEATLIGLGITCWNLLVTSLLQGTEQNRAEKEGRRKLKSERGRSEFLVKHCHTV